jgi:hypothetical protein
MRKIRELFIDQESVNKIKDKLPKLFSTAELESSRAGKIGMEVGSLRERILVALLIYKFGQENVNVNIPITESETDVFLFDIPISIKTITSGSLIGFKLIWTVDPEKAEHFLNNYFPGTDILFVRINWNSKGGFYYIPYEAQQEVYNKLGKNAYIKLPVKGTNPRGVEITNAALVELVHHPDTLCIEIDWKREAISNYNPFEKWVKLWSTI